MDFIKDERSKITYKKYYSMAENLYYGQIVRTKFLNPYELDLVLSIINKFDLFYYIYKSHENNERSILMFSQLDEDFEKAISEELGVFFIEKKNHNLSHRDVLGSLMSLGVERDLIGDIIVNDDLIEMVLLKEISDYILFNLTSIKNLKVQLEEKNSIYMNDSLVKYEDRIITISSLRLDSFVSAAINVSRNDAKNLVLKEHVKLNYVIESNPSHEINEGDSISIRGFGRFYFEEYINKSRKDKDRILIRKLV